MTRAIERDGAAGDTTPSTTGRETSEKASLLREKQDKDNRLLGQLRVMEEQLTNTQGQLQEKHDQLENSEAQVSRMEDQLTNA